MIQNLKKTNNDLFSLWNFLKHNVHSDFYLTENNRRVFITDYKSFKRILSQSHSIFVSKEGSDINGIIMLWKGSGGSTQRCYIKINAINENIADKLLTVLLWDTNKEIYIKIKKFSPYLPVFRDKRFNFLGGRGKELLLVYKKRDKYYGHNTNKYRNTGPSSNRR